MLAIPIKYTMKRRLDFDEIEQIAAKRFRVLEVSTEDDIKSEED